MIRSTVAALLLAAPGAAWACGGFFCNNTQPVDQTAEEILFEVDGDAGTTTMHVKIMYEGPAEEFSWVVPVAAQPELGVGTDALFAQLSNARAQFQLEGHEIGTCEDGWRYDYAYTSTPANSTSGGVHIVETGVVGPYETVVLTATNTEDLVSWLGANGYDIPPGFDGVVAPYVAEGSHFVGLKLQKDKDTGDLAPLVLTYEGTTPTIPIQLTSVAATPDMRLRVYVLGDHRAVPESYLHVRLNHMAVDWWTAGSNFEEVVSMAADEAGGHAFATDYSGAPEIVGPMYLEAWSERLTELAASPDVVAFLDDLQWSGLPADSALLDVLLAHLPNADTGMFNCPSCYEAELLAMPFDPAACVADIEAVVLEPRREAQEMLDRSAVLTRMTSSVSPVEMTVDPVFVFNPDMPEQPSWRTAMETANCAFESDWYEAPRVLTLEDGRSVDLPSRAALDARGITEIEYLTELHEPYAAMIERTSASGMPEVLVDNTQLLHDQLVAFQGGDDRASKGCGCNSGSGTPGAVGLLGLVLLGLRRRL